MRNKIWCYGYEISITHASFQYTQMADFNEACIEGPAFLDVSSQPVSECDDIFSQT